MNEDLLKRYLDHTEDNEAEILSSDKVACLSCGSLSSAREVKEWDDDGGKVKACCPLCGLPTIVGDSSGLPFDPDTLAKVKAALLSRGGDKEYQAEMKRYCDRFVNEEIAHSEESEKIFLRYCHLLAEHGNHDAYLDLGDFYMNGGVAIPSDLDKAIHYYSSPILAHDIQALINLAIIYRIGTPKHKSNPKKVIDLLTRAVMLGSHKAKMLFCDLYDEGEGVKPDPFLSTKVLSSLYDLAYHSYLIQGYDSDLDLGEIAARLFSHFHQGFGAPVDEEGAFGLALVAEHCYQTNPEQYNEDLPRQIQGYINDASMKFHYQPGEMVFDVDTFNDTMLMMPQAFLLRLSNLSFDESEHTLTFDLLSPTPILLVDYASISTKVLSGSQTFVFDSVASIKGEETDNINFSNFRLEGDSLRFYRLSGDGETEVFRIVLFPKEAAK